MKFIITESQFKMLLEQKSDNLMPFQPEKFGYRKDDPKTLEPALKKQSETIKNIANLNPDTLVDIVSILFDGIPGIGNLVSAGIDITHALTYLGRFFLNNNEDSKIENGVMAIITFGSTFIPIGGNSLNIIARQGIRQTIKQTPKELLVIAKKIGLYDKTVFLLSKTKWKYSILLALARITVNTSLDNFLYDVSNKLSELKKYIINNSFGKIYMPAINYMISFLNEMLSDWELTKKLQKGYQV
jgi:hypothetical protein